MDNMKEKLIKYFRNSDNYLNTRLKSSTIVETLVATIIIVLIFSIASLTLNNLFKAEIGKDTSAIENRLDKLIYLKQNGKIVFPYREEFNDWTIKIHREDKMEASFFVFEAAKSKGGIIIRKSVVNVYN